MATRALNKLTSQSLDASGAKRLPAGRHADGGGLYFNVAPAGSKSWVFLWTKSGKRREMGLGAYPEISLAKARERARECRELVADGRDPIEEKKREAEPTFSECVTQFLDAMEKQWRNAKHRLQWRNTLGADYCSSLQSKRVSQIGTAEILEVLAPIWHEKAETASRIRGRLERVLDFAATKGWRTGQNPAVWRGHLKNVLPKRAKLTRGHHSAMPYDQIPAFLADLRTRDSMAARALEFLILTAARTGEILGATWSEIDWKGKIWTVPASRMKAGAEHRVPLTAAALAVLRALYETRSSDDLIFPSAKVQSKKAGTTCKAGSFAPMSQMAMPMLMRRMKQNRFTVHGFRSGFRDWCGDETSFPRDLAEQALAHTIGNKTEQAYRRKDALEKRRELMNAWARYLEQTSGNVVKLQAS